MSLIKYGLKQYRHPVHYIKGVSVTLTLLWDLQNLFFSSAGEVEDKHIDHLLLNRRLTGDA